MLSPSSKERAHGAKKARAPLPKGKKRSEIIEEIYVMKKILPFLCASALALSLMACAGTINNSTADTASNVTFTFT